MGGVVSSSDLKYKLMRLSTHYFSGLLQDLFHVFYIHFRVFFIHLHFFKGTSVSITFYLFERYQLWMMDSKAQRVFCPKTGTLCVLHTEVSNSYTFKLGRSFSTVSPKMESAG